MLSGWCLASHRFRKVIIQHYDQAAGDRARWGEGLGKVEVMQE